jgi:malonyl-CoA O-methyltransferase
MHDLGDALVGAGFSDPVMDMEMLTVTYTSLDDLLRDLRTSGSANAATTRPRGLVGKGHWQKLRANYEQLRHDGRLPATVEVVYGHAWKAAPKLAEDGRAIVRFERKPG